MASIVSDLHRQLEEAIPYADPRTSNWLLVENNPVYVWILSALYIIFVVVGPSYMKNRQPYSLQTFLVVYNLGLVALSLYMFVEILLSTSAAEYQWMCAPFGPKSRENPAELRVARVLWWYFFSKAIELLDTVLMVLRKKNQQISFLHVFHHVSMLNIWWWVMMFIPGGLAYFGSGLNCLVHVVMYAYYGLAAIPSLREKLWWKKYITKFQLMQFCITLTHTMITIWSGCDFPEWGKNLLGGYMIIMLILFTNFYVRSYLNRAPRHSSKNGSIVQNGSTASSSNGVSPQSNGSTHHTNHYSNGTSSFKKAV